MIQNPQNTKKIGRNNWVQKTCNTLRERKKKLQPAEVETTKKTKNKQISSSNPSFARRSEQCTTDTSEARSTSEADTWRRLWRSCTFWPASISPTPLLDCRSDSEFFHNSFIKSCYWLNLTFVFLLKILKLCFWTIYLFWKSKFDFFFSLL